MTLTLWHIEEDVAVFEDDQMVGWDTRRSVYTVTRGVREESDLVEHLADVNDCEVRVSMKKVMEIPVSDLPEVINAITRSIPRELFLPHPFRTALEIRNERRAISGG